MEKNKNYDDYEVEELQSVVIREPYLRLIESYYGKKQGSHMRAAFLNNLLFWQKVQLKSDRSHRAKIKNAIDKKRSERYIEQLKKEYRDGWFYKTSEEFDIELMGFCSAASVTRMTEEFKKQGWLEKDKLGEMKYDRKNYYRLNLVKISKDLENLGYHLEDFKVTKKVKTEQEMTKDEETPEALGGNIFHGENDNEALGGNIFHGENTIFHGENTIFHGERTITEGTSLGTSESLEEEEEEEEHHSELIQFLLLKDIKEEHAKRFETRLIEREVKGFTYDDVIEALTLSFGDFNKGDCVDPYLWAVGKLERLLDSKKYAKRKKKNNSYNKTSANDIIPDWFAEGKHKQKPEDLEQSSEEMNEEQKKVAEKLKELQKEYQEV